MGPRPHLRGDHSAGHSYFQGDTGPLDADIANWSFFTDKTVSDRKTIGCAFGTCLAFRADGAACAVFRHQIGSAGPRLYGFYCGYATETIRSSEMDAVLRGLDQR